MNQRVNDLHFKMEVHNEGTEDFQIDHRLQSTRFFGYK